MKSVLNSIWKAWDGFWFAARDLRALAFMRILVGASLVWGFSVRGLYNIDFYTEESLVPREKALELFMEYFRPYFAWFFWPDSWAPFVHTLFVVLLVLMTLGLSFRPLIFLSWVFHIGFLHRNYAVAYGADLITTVLLFYLSLTRCCDYWSLKNKIFGRRVGYMSDDMLSSAAYRLIQVHLGIIYGYTGFEKLKGATWWDGTALWSVFGNPQMVMWDMSFMRNFPLTISLITFITIIYEIYWPFAVMTRVRYLWLFVGVLFHIGIAATMNIWVFSFLMMAPYFLFLKSEHLDRFQQGVKWVKAHVISK